MTPEERVARDADRADWLERIARLLYETETMGEDALADELFNVLHDFEQAWGIKVEEPYYQYFTANN